MYYYAYINSNSQVVWVGSMPTQTTADGYIQITEEQYNSGDLVGKYWNGSEFVDTLVHYYAVLNAKDVVIDVIEYEGTLSGTTVIEISSLDMSLINLWYDRNGDQTFKVQPIHIQAQCSTDEINYANENKWLTVKIQELEVTIDENTDEINIINSNISDINTSITNINSNISDINSNISDINSKIGTLSNLNTTEKNSLVGAVNELFTNVNDGKTAISGAIVDKNGTVSTNPTFSELATAIRNLPTGAQMASGTINEAYNDKTFNVGFIPKLIILWVVEHSNQYVCGVGFFIGLDWHEVYGESQYYGNTYCVPNEPNQSGQIRLSMPSGNTVIEQVHWTALRW